MISSDNEKNQKIAIENINYFYQKGISLEGKKVLDVGFGLGYNSNIMKELGAEVYGVEPDKEAFLFAVNNNLIDREKAFNCSLQDIPQELIGTFDIVTVFLYNVSYRERVCFAQALASVINPDGIAIIGVHDDVYINGDEYIAPIIESITKVFCNVGFKYTDNITDKFFINASVPNVVKKRL